MENDPKCHTNTQRRAELAADRIPRLIGELQVRARQLDEQAVELLYGEYRAFHRGGGPFRSTIERCDPTDTHLFDSWGVTQLLNLLRAPQQLTRKEAVRALCRLRVEITNGSESLGQRR